MPLGAVLTASGPVAGDPLPNAPKWHEASQVNQLAATARYQVRPFKTPLGPMAMLLLDGVPVMMHLQPSVPVGPMGAWTVCFMVWTPVLARSSAPVAPASTTARSGPRCGVHAPASA